MIYNLIWYKISFIDHEISSLLLKYTTCLKILWSKCLITYRVTEILRQQIILVNGLVWNNPCTLYLCFSSRIYLFVTPHHVSSFLSSGYENEYIYYPDIDRITDLPSFIHFMYIRLQKNKMFDKNMTSHHQTWILKKMIKMMLMLKTQIYSYDVECIMIAMNIFSFLKIQAWIISSPCHHTAITHNFRIII